MRLLLFLRKLAIFFLLLHTPIIFAENEPPKLILQLVVDQLRGDLLPRYQKKFQTNGFNYLRSHALDYQNAHHPHANTVTCVGHATIATGSYPALHGIVGNNWYNRKTGQLIYCIEDPQNPLLPTNHTQKILYGRSPKNLLASTLSDELLLARAGRAFAISFKDRAAITMAGHSGKAFWFDKKNGGMVTSRYYYSTYPSWVTAWNTNYQAKKETWTLKEPLANYSYQNPTQLPSMYQEFSNTFPHHLDPILSVYYKLLAMTPFADELTADFAIKLLQQEKLGTQTHKTDYLAVSFSATDAIGHQFGPNSLESEDNLLRLDSVLAKLLAAIDKQVGLKNTLIVLTSDHGVSESASYLAANMTGGTFNLAPVLKQKLLEGLNHFDLPNETLQAIVFPYIYLDHKLIKAKGLTVNQVSNYLAEILQNRTKLFQVYSLPIQQLPSWLSKKVLKMTYGPRSGDLYVITPPYQTPLNTKHSVTHGSPWQYDSYVPLLFVNPLFRPQRISRAVSTVDIAPTLAAILNIKFPSSSVGKPLSEVVEASEGSAGESKFLVH